MQTKVILPRDVQHDSLSSKDNSREISSPWVARDLVAGNLKEIEMKTVKDFTDDEIEDICETATGFDDGFSIVCDKYDLEVDNAKNILYELGYDFCQGCACVFNINEMDDGICPTCMDELQEESGEGV